MTTIATVSDAALAAIMDACNGVVTVTLERPLSVRKRGPWAASVVTKVTTAQYNQLRDVAGHLVRNGHEMGNGDGWSRSLGGGWNEHASKGTLYRFFTPALQFISVKFYRDGVEVPRKEAITNCRKEGSSTSDIYRVRVDRIRRFAGGGVVVTS